MEPKEGEPKLTYSQAGVDVDAANLALGLIKGHVRSTFRPGVLGDVGFFGGLFELKGYKSPVLVSSTDGVGTKLKVASALGKHDTVGIDLVNHCVNDIFTCGAEPLFFLDYFATGKLVPEHLVEVVRGLAEACRAVGCALIGGETAEMPGLYAPGDYDLVGFIVGVVEKEGIIDGSSIKKGDVLLGLPSSGLHTNGYSLARRVFGLDGTRDAQVLSTFYPELGRSLGEELLEPHRCYYPLLKPHLPRIKGMAHITGGGLLDNVPRILPSGLSARFQRGSWLVHPIFSLIQRLGNLEEGEMYRTFNMGLGMVLTCAPEEVAPILEALPQTRVVGQVAEQEGEERVLIVETSY